MRAQIASACSRSAAPARVRDPGRRGRRRKPQEGPAQLRMVHPPMQLPDHRQDAGRVRLPLQGKQRRQPPFPRNFSRRHMAHVKEKQREQGPLHQWPRQQVRQGGRVPRLLSRIQRHQNRHRQPGRHLKRSIIQPIQQLGEGLGIETQNQAVVRRRLEFTDQ